MQNIFPSIQLPAGEILLCVNCGNELGRTLRIQSGDDEGVQVLQLGGVLVHEMQGVCSKCGMGVWQSVNARRLQRLLERIIQEPLDARSLCQPKR